MNQKHDVVCYVVKARKVEKDENLCHNQELMTRQSYYEITLIVDETPITVFHQISTKIILAEDENG